MTNLAIGAVGAIIRVTVRENRMPLDISTATVKEIRLYREGKEAGSFEADFLTDGIDGVLQYTTTTSTDLGALGNYIIRCYLEMLGYSGLTMETDGFTVK